MNYRYRKVSTRIWTDEKFRNLSPHAKLLFLFFLTNPQMLSLGVTLLSACALFSGTVMAKKTFNRSLSELVLANLLKTDDKAGVTVVPNFIKHNPPANPNIVKGWVKMMGDFPRCELLDNYLISVHQFLKQYNQQYAILFQNGIPIRGKGKGDIIQRERERSNRLKHRVMSDPAQPPPAGPTKPKPASGTAHAMAAHMGGQAAWSKYCVKVVELYTGAGHAEVDLIRLTETYPRGDPDFFNQLRKLFISHGLKLPEEMVNENKI